MRQAIGRYGTNETGGAFVIGRRYLPLLVDALAWAAGLHLAVLTRYNFGLDGRREAGLVPMVSLAVALQAGFGYAGNLYRARFPFGTLDDVIALWRTVLAT